MRLQFNTGRLYRRDGQPIVATMIEDGSIYFHDTARHIAGRIDPLLIAPSNPRDFARLVMDQYDRGKYVDTWLFEPSVPKWDEAEEVHAFKL